MQKVFNGLNEIKLTPTRYIDKKYGASLFIGKVAPGCWRVFAAQDGRTAETGAICKKKDEVLSILPAVAEQWGITA